MLLLFQSELLNMVFCFFNDTATTEIYTLSYTLSLHDALPISHHPARLLSCRQHGSSTTGWGGERSEEHTSELQSHSEISYAVFCLKKKKQASCIAEQPVHVTSNRT